MNQQRFGDVVTHGENWIERRHRLLKDERDSSSTDCLHLGLGICQQVASLEADAAVRDSSGQLNQSHDRQRGDRLATAGLADKAECFTGANLEAHIVDGGDRARRQIEDSGQTIDGQKGGRCHLSLVSFGSWQRGDWRPSQRA